MRVADVFIDALDLEALGFEITPEATGRPGYHPATMLIRRFLLHILPKGFHRIRHYGLFASTGRAANIERLRELLGSMPPAEASASPSQDEPAETVLPPCPCCGGRMTIIETFERGMQPRYRPSSAAVIGFDTS